MATIQKYTKKDGSKAYMFKEYLGTDPLTRKQRLTTRRGLKMIKEAKIDLSRLILRSRKKWYRCRKNFNF